MVTREKLLSVAFLETYVEVLAEALARGDLDEMSMGAQRVWWRAVRQDLDTLIGAKLTSLSAP